MSGKITTDLKQLEACSHLCALSRFSHVWLFVTPWTVARQAPLSTGILLARILEWVAISFSRDLPNSGIEPVSLMFPALAGRFFTTSTTWETPSHLHREYKCSHYLLSPECSAASVNAIRVREGGLHQPDSFPSFFSIKNKVFQKDLSRFYPTRAFVVFENEYCFSSIQKDTSKSKTTSAVPARIKHLTPFPTFSSSKVIPSERKETIFKQLCFFFF